MAKKRRVRTWVKVVLVAIPIIAAITCLIIFGFKLKDIKYASDLNQFTKEEVKDYLDKNDINNSFTLWFRDMIGKETSIDLFEDYDVKLKSLNKVKITSHERKLKGYLNVDKQFYCFDSMGKLLKISNEKIDKPKVVGPTIKSSNLYERIKTSNQKQYNTAVEVADAVDEYDFVVKKIEVDDNCEVSIYIKKLKVELGPTNNLTKKLKDLNDMYKNVKKSKGVLNMKKVNREGQYILKKSKK